MKHLVLIPSLFCLLFCGCCKDPLEYNIENTIEVTTETEITIFVNGYGSFHGAHVKFVDGYLNKVLDTIFVAQNARMQYGMDSVYNDATGMMVLLDNKVIAPYQEAPFSGEYSFANETHGTYGLKFCFDDGFHKDFFLVIKESDNMD